MPDGEKGGAPELSSSALVPLYGYGNDTDHINGIPPPPTLHE
jgi:hypothetical protein